LNSSENRVLLAVLAHPDDETFGTGGTLAYYASQGVQVHLVCATLGEVGEVDERYLRGFASIAERRQDELRCAAEKLGLTGVHFLGYRDSGMPGSPDNQHANALAAQPVDNVAADVAHFFRLLKPQVVITFDPIGGYRHPDHIAIQRATVRAFEAGEALRLEFPNPLPGPQNRDPLGCGGIAKRIAQRYPDNLPAFQPQKLYFQTIPHGLMRLAVTLLRLVGQDPRHIGRNKDIDLVSITEVDFPIDAIIDYRSVAKIRDEASLCHASQGGSEMSRGPLGWLRRVLFSRETYMRAYPPPVKEHTEHDLFEGVRT
jgi:N-acetyl-1-D-myo-inositol-2-amino-2-deoxy-alpha-D-glucopyranoside deacetylase